MALEADFLQRLTLASAEEAWSDIIQKILEITSKPLTPNNALSEVSKRDREIGTLDHFLSTSGWDLWQVFGETVERTSNKLIHWWAEPFQAKAVLILDGLSLRELPWLLMGADEHGLTLHKTMATASELPGETTEFARSLGFNNRSQLQNNGGGFIHKLQPAYTESVDMPWKDCEALVDSSPNWIFWHHWPDSKVHDGSGAGQGLETLTRDALDQLFSKEFWSFIERLATGRRLVITSDHGYAATGTFPDADEELGQFLKKTFGSRRNAAFSGEIGHFVPPVALQHGSQLMAVGRWKWKNQGGYPTLTHGGLSLLEVLSPFVELSK